jgi:large conductance mechanosensitive channel
MGKVDFSKLSLSLGGDVRLSYGEFIQNIVQFIIIAFSVFLMVKFINKFRKEDKPSHSAKK